MRPRALAPAGAAMVASRLALYAALVKTDAVLPPDAPAAHQAAALAKRILLAWAAHGFRDEGGKLRQSASQYCAPGVPPSPIAIPLQIARGVVQSVHAQDLLQGIGAFGSEEETRLNGFHAAMYEVIRSLSNEEFDYNARVKARLRGCFSLVCSI